MYPLSQTFSFIGFLQFMTSLIKSSRHSQTLSTEQQEKSTSEKSLADNYYLFCNTMPHVNATHSAKDYFVTQCKCKLA